MVGLILVAAVVLVAVVGTVLELWRDQPREVPRSRGIDPDAVPPAQRLGRS